MMSLKLAGSCAAICLLGALAVAQENTSGTKNGSRDTSNLTRGKEYFESLNHVRLEPGEVGGILDKAEKAAGEVASFKGLRTTEKGGPKPGKYHIFVVDRRGVILGSRMQPDAWAGSIDIAVGKARTASFFSSDENALTSRDIGALSQAHGANGTGKAGPLWGIGETNKGDGRQSSSGIATNTLVTFPGGVPLYKDGHLVGAIGVSGDGVDQDEAVALGGAEGFLPGDGVGMVSKFEPQGVEPVK